MCLRGPKTSLGVHCTGMYKKGALVFQEELLYIQNMEAGEMYQVVIVSDEVVSEATYKLEMDYSK